jgi:hypothetical protein
VFHFETGVQDNKEGEGKGRSRSVQTGSQARVLQDPETNSFLDVCFKLAGIKPRKERLDHRGPVRHIENLVPPRVLEPADFVASRTVRSRSDQRGQSEATFGHVVKPLTFNTVQGFGQTMLFDRRRG